MDDGILVHYYGVGFDRYTCNSWSYSFTLFTKFTSFLGEVSCLKGNLSLIQTSFVHPAQNVSVESSSHRLHTVPNSVLIYVISCESRWSYRVTYNVQPKE